MRTEAGKARLFHNLPLRDFGEANVRFGSKPDVTLLNFDALLYPRKRTFAHAIRMSALGQ
jgi:hypothetical protein